MNEMLPDAAAAQLRGICEALGDILGARLAGLYLHGSAAMGCFCPATSDLDLLGVCEGPLSEGDQRAIARALLALDGHPNTIEISILDRARIHPWRHPAPYEFHFSSMHTGRFRDMLASDAFDAGGDGDPDLAAHVSVCRARGVALAGPAAADMFDPVPYRDYFLSAADDFDWLMSPEVGAVYGVLNTCRILRLSMEEGVYSKRECGLWALAREDMPEKPLIRRALEAYAAGERFARDAALARLIDYARPFIARRREQLDPAG